MPENIDSVWNSQPRLTGYDILLILRQLSWRTVSFAARVDVRALRHFNVWQ